MSELMIPILMCVSSLLQALMYEDPTRWGLTLQTYIQLTVLDHHLSTIVSVLPALHLHRSSGSLYSLSTMHCC